MSLCLENAQKIIEELTSVCKKHGVALIGTADCIYGDIVIAKVSDIKEWPDAKRAIERITNCKLTDCGDGVFEVNSIGKVDI